MEIGNQIKKYRIEKNLSQDELAQQIYVSRQTISNWETGKNYPDVKSLLLLSTLFHVTLDILIKGDLQEMKEKVNYEKTAQFKHDGNIFSIALIAMMAMPVPLQYFFGKKIGFIVWAVIAGVAIFYAAKVEKHKKSLDIQTYKEILAFTQGDSLSAEIKNQEIGKRPYQKLLLAVAAGCFTLLFAMIMIFLLK